LLTHCSSYFSGHANRALPVLIIAGKVSKGTFQLQQERASDMDVAQYAGSSSQNLRVRCYFPDGSQFAKTPDHHTPPTIL
jgi:hypothetical protein